MQNAQKVASEVRRRKERDDILLSMERMLDQIRDERETFQERMDQGGREMSDKVDKALDIGSASAKKMEERITRVQRETVSTLQRIEDKVEDSMHKIESRVDVSSKAIQTMTTVAVFGFSAVTLAIIVLFFILLGNI